MTRLRGLAALMALGLLATSVTACSDSGPNLPRSSTPGRVAVPAITANPSGPSHSPAPVAPPSITPTDAAGLPVTPGSSSGGSAGGSPGGTSGGRWKPAAQVTWQWQLSGRLDLTVDAQVYDVDLFDTSAAQVAQLQSQGRRVICYMSAGSYESGRPDSGQFPATVLGNPLSGWPGEKWLDIRALDTLLPIMAARMDLCVQKGFDAVEPDNVDGYQNNSGFNLTAKDQENYNRALAQLAHDRGLAVGLKNDLDQVALLQSAFDFAVNEQCAEYDECSMLSPFIAAGKPVLHVEYDLPLASFCPTTKALGFSSMLKSLDLDAARTPCP